MSIEVTGTKEVPVSADRLIIFDSEEQDVNLALKEISFDNLRIADVAETAYDEPSRTRTYTIYSDLAQNNPIGSFPVVDGTDGSGSSVPPWAVGVTYTLNQVVTSTLLPGAIFRSLNAVNLANSPPADGVTTAFWDVVSQPVGGMRVVDTDTAVRDGETLFVNTFSNAVTITLTPNVNSFTLQDYSDNWNDTNLLTLNLGRDQITFGTLHAGRTYKCVREGMTLRMYDQNNTVTAGLI